jgi:DNA-binding NtrC family response regulator
MAQLVFLVPGSDDPVSEPLEAGQVLLLGRNPNPARLDRGALPGGQKRIRAVMVSSSLISENHLLAWREGSTLFLRDLNSKNGTVAGLPPGRPIAFPDEGPLLIAIAKQRQGRRDSAPHDDAPHDADWASEEGYPHAIAQEITDWLTRRGLGAVASVRATPGREHGGPTSSIGPIPLGGGYYIHVVEKPGLQRGGLASAADTLWRYIGEQEARWRIEQRRGGPLVQASRGFRSARRETVLAAARGLRVVLQGEPGTGKRLLAQCYAQHAPVKTSRFVAVSCLAFEQTTQLIDLFGARRGTWLDAGSDMAGAVERADGGVLFLREVAQLGSEAQARLIHFLDTGRYTRRGDDSERSADVTVVCSSSVDLRKAAAQGAFRLDLWHRLAARVIDVPPLRERREDIEAYLRLCPLGDGPDGPSAHDALHPDAVKLAVQRHEWPGNFRELEGFVRRIPVKAIDHAISAAACKSIIEMGKIDDFRAEDTTPPSTVRIADLAPPLDAASLCGAAIEVFRKMNGGAEIKTVAELEALYEQVLKPLFFARRLGLPPTDALPRSPTYSYRVMGEQLDCTEEDVKRQLERYVALRPYLGKP